MTRKTKHFFCRRENKLCLWSETVWEGKSRPTWIKLCQSNHQELLFSSRKRNQRACWRKRKSLWMKTKIKMMARRTMKVKIRLSRESAVQSNNWRLRKAMETLDLAFQIWTGRSHRKKNSPRLSKICKWARSTLAIANQKRALFSDIVIKVVDYEFYKEIHFNYFSN